MKASKLSEYGDLFPTQKSTGILFTPSDMYFCHEQLYMAAPPNCMISYKEVSV
jgi:hypothetical protein